MFPPLWPAVSRLTTRSGPQEDPQDFASIRAEVHLPVLLADLPLGAARIVRIAGLRTWVRRRALMSPGAA
jgi:hypothetical protein